MALMVRLLTVHETEELRRLTHSRTAPHLLVQRAQLVWARARGETVPAIAAQVGLSALRVRAWLHRFKWHGLTG
jgi:hypothetical protein